ncbi:MAG TPA: hypothetical protein IGS37_03325 [Synechococcales cyanobacterium M55_K2018_004]|nr:hypothetical protein [Synechococcales cyanobacterium M55_K2018_004]
MSQQDNFFGGFLVGAIFGGVVGGVVGVLVANRLSRSEVMDGKDALTKKLEGKGLEKRPVASAQNMEVARRGLEDKIAQLNEAIDDVRLKLGGMNGTPRPDGGTQAIADRRE